MLIKDDPERIVRIALIDQKLASSIEPSIFRQNSFFWMGIEEEVCICELHCRKCATAVIHYWWQSYYTIYKSKLIIRKEDSIVQNILFVFHCYNFHFHLQYASISW